MQLNPNSNVAPKYTAANKGRLNDVRKEVTAFMYLLKYYINTENSREKRTVREEISKAKWHKDICSLGG